MLVADVELSPSFRLADHRPVRGPVAASRLADSLKVGVPDLFNYELEPKELAQLVAGLIAEGDEIKLRLAAKVLNAICR
jgi:hypothetical protein